MPAVERDNFHPWAHSRLERLGVPHTQLNKTLNWGLRPDELNRMFVRHEPMRIEKIQPVVDSLREYLTNTFHWTEDDFMEHIYIPDTGPAKELTPEQEREAAHQRIQARKWTLEEVDALIGSPAYKGWFAHRKGLIPRPEWLAAWLVPEAQAALGAVPTELSTANIDSD